MILERCVIWCRMLFERIYRYQGFFLSGGVQECFFGVVRLVTGIWDFMLLFADFLSLYYIFGDSFCFESFRMLE